MKVIVEMSDDPALYIEDAHDGEEGTVEIPDSLYKKYQKIQRKHEEIQQELKKYQDGQS